MKAQDHSSPRPRLVCRLIRIASIVFSRTPERHLESCGACREAFHAMESVEHALRRQASRESASPPPPEGMEARIINAVTQPLRACREPRSSLTWRVALGATLGAAALAFVLLTPDQQRPGNIDTGPPLVARMDDSPESPTQQPQSISELVAPVRRLVTEDPMEREIDALRSDVHSAWRFLAANFIPDYNSMEGDQEPIRRDLR